MSSTAFVSFLVAYAVCWSIAKGQTTKDDAAKILDGDDASSTRTTYTTAKQTEPSSGNFKPIEAFPSNIQTSFFIAAATTLCILLSCSFIIGLYEVRDRKRHMPVKTHT
ncbi:hypothetical protein V3C99_016797 [Haemonchus contortus]|uniref:Secreted protein n=1 Tax=Haemonchus contortus TaxID=6289 RepID=A0A7I4YZ44_HAECO